MGVGWCGWGWVESRIRLISAETEAEALLGLAELGKNEKCSKLHELATKLAEHII